MQPKVGGKLHLKLNTGTRPIANKYREGKVKSTLKREFKKTVKPLGGKRMSRLSCSVRFRNQACRVVPVHSRMELDRPREVSGACLHSCTWEEPGQIALARGHKAAWEGGSVASFRCVGSLSSASGRYSLDLRRGRCEASQVAARWCCAVLSPGLSVLAGRGWALRRVAVDGVPLEVSGHTLRAVGAGEMVASDPS